MFWTVWLGWYAGRVCPAPVWFGRVFSSWMPFSMPTTPRVLLCATGTDAICTTLGCVYIPPAWVPICVTLTSAMIAISLGLRFSSQEWHNVKGLSHSLHEASTLKRNLTTTNTSAYYFFTSVTFCQLPESVLHWLSTHCLYIEPCFFFDSIETLCFALVASYLVFARLICGL